ncbi:MAG TPA: DUF167 domain-containing protein [Terriglobia bacterium]|nr:DUF167 domain-containing protein [Terriglobia bacterium]
MSDYTVDGNRITFWLRVKPHSRRERLLRDSSGELCLDLSAPPVEGKANEAAIEFLARSLRVPRSAIEIVTGAKSRRKLFRITVGRAQDTIDRLNALVREKGQ